MSTHDQHPIYTTAMQQQQPPSRRVAFQGAQFNDHQPNEHIRRIPLILQHWTYHHRRPTRRGHMINDGNASITITSDMTFARFAEILNKKFRTCPTISQDFSEWPLGGNSGEARGEIRLVRDAGPSTLVAPPTWGACRKELLQMENVKLVAWAHIINEGDTGASIPQSASADAASPRQSSCSNASTLKEKEVEEKCLARVFRRLREFWLEDYSANMGREVRDAEKVDHFNTARNRRELENAERLGIRQRILLIAGLVMWMHPHDVPGMKMYPRSMSDDNRLMLEI